MNRAVGRAASRVVAVILAVVVPARAALADWNEWCDTATPRVTCVVGGGPAPATAPIHAETDVAYTQEGERVFLREDSVIEVKLLDGLDSRTARRGDGFRYLVLTDVVCLDRRIVREGTTGTGKVLAVGRRGWWGRPGWVLCGFSFVATVRGTPVRLALTRRARDPNVAEGFAAGASLIGLAACGPLGLVGGAFVTGRDVRIPAGSVFRLGAEDNVDVTGRSTLDRSRPRKL